MSYNFRLSRGILAKNAVVVDCTSRMIRSCIHNMKFEKIWLISGTCDSLGASWPKMPWWSSGPHEWLVLLAPVRSGDSMTRIHKHIHTYTHTHTHTYTRTHTHTQTRACTHTCTQTRTHAHTHTRSGDCMRRYYTRCDKHTHSKICISTWLKIRAKICTHNERHIDI